MHNVCRAGIKGSGAPQNIVLVELAGDATGTTVSVSQVRQAGMYSSMFLGCYD